MTTWIAVMIWFGGISAAYALNRGRGTGRFWSALEALTWPAGLGYGICIRFYVNRNWGKK